MKAGVRALGVAESFEHTRSTLAGVVVRRSRVVDGCTFATCSVGGTDATSAVLDLVSHLSREDVQYIFIAGIAPAWFNVLDLQTIAARTGRPVLSISFDTSPGLDAAIREAFGEDASVRLERYRSQPDRRQISVNDETVYVRSIGLEDEDPAEIVRAFTPTGGRPEPLRVARMVARAGDAARRRWQSSGLSEE